MVGWGILLIVLGAGSLLLPMFDMQFTLMELVDPSALRGDRGDRDRRRPRVPRADPAVRGRDAAACRRWHGTCRGRDGPTPIDPTTP
jgi:hypothetical protein